MNNNSGILFLQTKKKKRLFDFRNRLRIQRRCNFLCILCFIYTLIFSHTVYAQFSEQFGSQQFPVYPPWQGNTDFFKLTSSTAIPTDMRPGLQLNDSAAGQSYISSPVSVASSDSLLWSFWVKLSFTPSVNNFARFYLISSTPVLHDTTQGLFVSIGENSKRLGLYRQTSGGTQLIIEGPLVNKTTNAIRVEIRKDNKQVYELRADITGNQSYISYGKAIVPLSYKPAWYIGLFCRYTLSNAQKFYWDDIFLQIPTKDTVKPFITSFEVAAPNQIHLFFSKELDSISVHNENHYLINAPHELMYIQSQPKKISLAFYPDFKEDQNYILSIKEMVDIQGNIMIPMEIAFTLPSHKEEEKPYLLKKGVLLISEVLFNPLSGEAAFIELYNASPGEINLNDAQLATLDTLTQNITHFTPVGKGIRVKGHDYVVITTKKAVLQTRYPLCNPEKCVEVKALPPYGRKEGIILLTNFEGKTMDRFDYSEKMHFVLLQSKQGISLERKSFSLSTNDSHNWQSASEASGGATPSYQNSQQSLYGTGEDLIHIDPAYFSPDEDGIDDYLTITYHLNESGWLCNLTIYDTKGLPVRKLLRNEWLGTEGMFTWDGKNDNHQSVAAGNYIVFAELFNTEGIVLHFKKAAALLRK